MTDATTTTKLPAEQATPVQATTAHTGTARQPHMALDSGASWVQATGSLAFVIALLLALSYGLKRLQARGFLGHKPSNNPHSQLAIDQSIMLDPKTRLLLVRRGTVGHLICLHGQGVTLVESGIALASSSPKEPTA